MTSLAPQPGVVLVHGAYADGSSWSEVIERPQRAGLAALLRNFATYSPGDPTPRIMGVRHVARPRLSPPTV